MYRTSITPRFNETDAVGHINNTTFPAWFEAGRRKFFEEFNPTLGTDPWTLIVVHYELNFYREVGWVSDVSVETSIDRVGNSSIVLLENLYQDGELCVTSKVTYVNVHPETRRPERITDAIRKKLTKHLKVEEL